MTDSTAGLMTLVGAIVAGDEAGTLSLLAASPILATERARDGATARTENQFYLMNIEHYLYAGDTALHVAAAAYQPQLVRVLLAEGAHVGARNRRGAQPLHYAADGMPGSHTWNPEAQAETIVCLIEAGADPNAPDKSGVTPLHRAVRTRCAAAVRALLEGGADPQRRHKSGSTAMKLATLTTGRGGTGSPEARVQQEEILRVLREYSG